MTGAPLTDAAKPRRRPSLWRDRRGVAAVEFAILAPVLCLLFGITVEVGRLLMAQRQFETAVIGVSRHVARYPEYEIRARQYAIPVAQTIFPGVDGTSLNLKVDSLFKESGVMKEAFAGNVIFGTDPGLRWQDNIDSADYVDEEAVIFVSATYNYKPLFPLIASFPIVMSKEVVILPSFGRKYPWNDGQVDESKYVY